MKPHNKHWLSLLGHGAWAEWTLREQDTGKTCFDWRKGGGPGGGRPLVRPWEAWLSESSLRHQAPGRSGTCWKTSEGTGKDVTQLENVLHLVYNSVSSQCACDLWHCNTAWCCQMLWHHLPSHVDSAKLQISAHSLFMAGKSPGGHFLCFLNNSQHERKWRRLLFKGCHLLSIPSLEGNQNHVHSLCDKFL